MLTRRQFVTAAGGAALAACSSRPQSPAPNIVLLMPDQFRGMAIAAMGNPDVKTPHLDRLATEGALLRRTYANCPVCCPARGTLQTGKYAHNHGVDINDAPLPSEELTIAEALKQRGYRTGFVGKWHLEGGKRQPGFVPPGPRRQGWDFWAANICSHDYWNMHYFRDDPQPIPMPGYSATTFTDEAINFIKQESEQPFLLYLQWGPPHNPYVAPPAYMNLYDPDAITLRPNWQEGARLGSRNDIAGYYAAITCIDDEVGRVLDALDETGQVENTIVLVTSDHGDMLGSHGASLKRKPWEESAHIPGILRYPAGVAPGSEPDLLLSQVDIPPTLLGMAGVPVPDDDGGRGPVASICSTRITAAASRTPNSPNRSICKAIRRPSRASTRLGAGCARNGIPTPAASRGLGCCTTTTRIPIRSRIWRSSPNRPRSSKSSMNSRWRGSSAPATPGASAKTPPTADGLRLRQSYDAGYLS